MLRLTVGAEQGRPLFDEARLLAMTERLAPTFVVAREAIPSADQIQAALGPGDWVALVRTKSGDPGFFAPIPRSSSSSSNALALEALAMTAEACFGMSAARFFAVLPRSPTVEAAESVLAGLGAASDAGPMAPNGAERVVYVLRRAFQRLRVAELLLQCLPLGPFGVFLSRDPKSGGRPLTKSGETLRTLLEKPVVSAVGPSAVGPELEALGKNLEQLLARPVRLACSLSNELIGVEVLRRSGLVAFEIASEQLTAGTCSPSAALASIEPADVAQVYELRLEAARESVLVTGVAAGAGVAEGHVAFSPAAAEELEREGLPAILVVHEVLPDEIAGVRAARGIVTVRGGITGEAAVMARGLSKPCVASGASLAFGEGEIRVSAGGVIRPGERITIDGRSGVILRGAAARVGPELPASARELLAALPRSADRPVAALVDHPAHVATAKLLGADEVVLLFPQGIVLEAWASSHSDPAAFIEARLLELGRAADELGLPLSVGHLPLGARFPAPLDRTANETDVAAVALALSALLRELPGTEEIVSPGHRPVGPSGRVALRLSARDGDAPEGAWSAVFALDPGALARAPHAPRRLLLARRPGSRMAELAATTASAGLLCELDELMPLRLVLSRNPPAA